VEAGDLRLVHASERTGGEICGDQFASMNFSVETRQVTARELGISKDIAGVNMRLNAGGVDRAHHGHRRARAKLRRLVPVTGL
jgi:hypothetical protein